MRILIEARSLINRGGTATYCRELIRNLIKIDKTNEYFIIVPSEQKCEFWAPNFKIVPIKSRGYFNQIKGNLKIKSLITEKSIDLVHYTKGIGPRLKNIKLVSTVNDIIPLTHPKFSLLLNRFYWQINLPQNIKRSNKIITISKYCKDSLIKWFPDSRPKIRVIYDGAMCKIRRMNKENGDYILFLSRVQKRKNIKRILLAFENVSSKNKNLKMLIAGEVPYEGKFVYSLINKNKSASKIKLLKHISENKKIQLLTNAKFLIFASLIEGFGLPILEAQACGCPVITSNLSSMPEVAGKGALFVNPYSVDEIEGAMEKVMKDSKLKENLIKEGYKNIKKYSWKKCAKETLSIYNEAYNE